MLFEEKEISSLGSDEWNLGKIILVTWLLLAMSVDGWYYFNSSTNATVAGKFLILFFVGLLFVIFDYLIKYQKGGQIKEGIDFPDSILYEKETMFGELPSVGKKAMLIVTIFIGLVIFWRIQSSPLYAVVSADTVFSTVDLGVVANLLLSGFSASSEDLVFFGIFFPTIYAFLYYFTKNYWFSLIVAVLLNPFAFTAWHWGVYGASQVSLQGVWQYGLFSTVFVAIFRNIAGIIPIHFGNNAGLVAKVVGG